MCQLHYKVEPAYNLPQKGFFVTCKEHDMQPYRCDSIHVADLDEALDVIFVDSAKYGIDFDDCRVHVKHN
jgi:hypothetical protein